jgi:hypothetical protein
LEFRTQCGGFQSCVPEIQATSLNVQPSRSFPDSLACPYFNDMTAFGDGSIFAPIKPAPEQRLAPFPEIPNL